MGAGGATALAVWFGLSVLGLAVGSAVAGNWAPVGPVVTLSFFFVAATTYVSLHALVHTRLESLAQTVARVSAGLPFDRASSRDVVSRAEAALRWLAAARDEERTLAERRQLLAAETARELDRLKTELVAQDRLATAGKLAAGVAHEVGNPLAGILGYLSVLRLGRSPSEQADTVARIEAEVQRIDRIVRALLELGRPSRGKPEPVDVRPLVEAAAGLLRSSEELRAVDVQIEGPPSLYARAEPGPLSQVVVNLLLNAGQALEGRGRVVVTLRSEGPEVIIDVVDDGPGIPAAALPRLFELFFTTKPAGKGTGLGLAVSRHLLSQVGGRLVAQNRTDGRGAHFSIGLPVP